jgi:hypothetical protein
VRRRGGPLTAAILVLLLALVGLGSRPRSLAPDQAVPATGAGLLLLQVLASLWILAALATLVLLLLLGPRRRRGQPDPRRRREPTRVHPLLKVLGVIVPPALFAALLALLLVAASRNPDALLPNALTALGSALLQGPDPARAPRWAPFPLVFGAVSAVVALLAIAAAIWLWPRARAAPALDEAPQLVQAVDDGLDALERETDPRRAVILAYVAMERSLAAQGLGRAAPETPIEYLLRVLARLPTCGDAVHRLTELFEEAKFSQHPIGQLSRAAAVQALTRLRQALQAGTCVAR